ncbi:hypothetical protein L3Y34_009798 [Caenorhabditis briggsae]|uniref:Uncharacterized protein n=1 Tax=Caenorhabditis briggsae TaxID=6238 RepID=A0AAE9D1Y5_CAEBR|nr:hypothetical protein L3Y34_009798 [Caenorhabditis briggsae]
MCSSTVPFRFLRNKHFREFCRKLNPAHQILDSRSSKVWISVDGWSAKYMDSTLYAVFVFYVENFERKSKLLESSLSARLQRQLMSAGLLLIYFTNLASI